MPVTYVGKGTFTASTAIPTPPTIPAGVVAGDLMYLLIHTSSQNVTVSAGWSNVTSQRQGIAGAAGCVGFDLWLKLATGSDSAPVLSDSGDHTFAVIVAYRGVGVSGAGGVATSVTAGSTTLSFLGTAPAVDNALILGFGAHSLDITGSNNVSSLTNSNLSAITTRVDESSSLGTGGGVVLWDGLLEAWTAAGAGTTTGTIASANSYTSTRSLLPLAPSLSSPTATSVTGTTATPQVTLTF